MGALIVTSYEDLSGIERSAILLNVLGNRVTGEVFKRLRDNDVKRLVTVMGQINKVPINIVKLVLDDFYTEISEEEQLIFGHASGKEFILETLGEDRAKTVLGQLAVVEGGRSLEALELVDPRTLANFLVNEHPQTTAVVLAHLSSDKKCEVLKKLPEPVQTEVVLRIANLDFISPSLLGQVDEILKQELATLGSIDTQQLGGVSPIAEMLNTMSSNTNIKRRISSANCGSRSSTRAMMLCSVFLSMTFNISAIGDTPPNC